MSDSNHVCEYLDYENQWIELVYPGTQYQRRVLMSPTTKRASRQSSEDG